MENRVSPVSGDAEGRTRLVFDHTGFPEEHRGQLDPGWHNKYRDSLKKYLQA